VINFWVCSDAIINQKVAPNYNKLFTLDQLVI
jgi:hypothetical protein